MMTLSAWLSKWLVLYVDASDLKWNTKQSYRRSVEALPEDLGQLDLAAAGAEAILSLRAWLLAVAKATPRAAQLDRVMLSRALATARALGLTQWPPITPETCPQIRHHAAEAAVLSLEELRAYLSAAPSAAPVTYPLLYLCACGLRRGEALGARRRDLDRERHALTVCGQRQRQGPTYVYVPLKTKASTRTLILPDPVWRAVEHTPLILGEDNSYIVPTTPERLRADHQRALRAAGVASPVTLHGLRHTLATQAAISGLPVQLLQRALGHSTIKLTADLYSAHLQTFPNALLPELFQAL